ncbi:MAG TPA: nucleotide pyrophosphohydrolase [Methanocella sp.]|nr:nucleotide pyrophosphohydrolase [Methanocella sp.]
MPSDYSTPIIEMKNYIKRHCEARDWDQYHNPKDLAIGIITESSELLELFRFRNEAEMDLMLKDDEKRGKICEELADVLFFTLRFAQLYDIDLTAEFYKKMKKNELHYPVEKAKGSNKKYDEI